MNAENALLKPSPHLSLFAAYPYRPPLVSPPPLAVCWQNAVMTTRRQALSPPPSTRLPRPLPPIRSSSLSPTARRRPTPTSPAWRVSNPTGDIDARNGGAYAAASAIPYSANVSYHFRLAVNIATQTYSIYVTPAGGSERPWAPISPSAFPTPPLNWYGVFVDAAGSGGAGSVTVCNFSTGLQAATPSFSPARGFL